MLRVADRQTDRQVSGCNLHSDTPDKKYEVKFTAKLKTDTLFVCSMLGCYCVCVVYVFNITSYLQICVLLSYVFLRALGSSCMSLYKIWF